MMKEAIASYKMQIADSFTLVELLIALAILSLLLVLGVPAISKVMEEVEQQRYVAEAEMVCTAVGLYLAEESLNGSLSEIEMAMDLSVYPLGDSRNVLTNRVEGYTNNAKIVSIHFSNTSMRFLGMIYEVNGYRITLYPGEGEPKIEKIKQ